MVALLHLNCCSYRFSFCSDVVPDTLSRSCPSIKSMLLSLLVFVEYKAIPLLSLLRQASFRPTLSKVIVTWLCGSHVLVFQGNFSLTIVSCLWLGYLSHALVDGSQLPALYRGESWMGSPSSCAKKLRRRLRRSLKCGFSTCTH